MLTASKLEQAAACPASAALPQAAQGKNEYSEAGDAKHLYLSKVAEMGSERALALVPEEHRDLCAGIDLEQLPLGQGYETEVAFAIDLATGRARRLGAHIGRDYQVAGEEVPGTADVVSSAEQARAQGFVEVADYKGAFAPVPPAERNWQLRFLAAAAARTYGVDRARVAIIRLREDGSTYRDEVELDALDLDLVLADLRRVVARVRETRALVDAGRTPDVHRGEHCRHCPAFATCPSNGRLLAIMATRPVSVAEELKDRLTPATARLAFEQFKRAEAVLHAVREALFAYAAENPIELEDGQVFGPHTVGRDQLNGRVVHQVLEARFGRELADLAVGYDATKASVRRALKAHTDKAGGKVAPLEREVLAAVGAAGGVVSKLTTRTEAHRPEAPANEPAEPGAGSAA